MWAFCEIENNLPLVHLDLLNILAFLFELLSDPEFSDNWDIMK